MVMYSKFAYGSQFSGENNDLKIRYLVAEILRETPVTFVILAPFCLYFQLGQTNALKHMLVDFHFSYKMASKKPKQKFEINFQENISEQLTTMTPTQLVRLFFTVSSLLPISLDLMRDFKTEFEEFFKMLGSVIGDEIRNNINTNKAPNIQDLAEVSIKTNYGGQLSLLCSFLSGLAGDFVNRNLTSSIIKSMIKLVLPDYNSLIGWRDSLVIYVRTHSRATIETLSTILANPSYGQIWNFIQRLKPTFSDIREDEDLITAVDNEQKLKKSYRIGGAEGSNKMTISLCTMVLHFYPMIKTKFQFTPSLSPAKWLWNRRPENFDEDKIFEQTLKDHKQNWWDNILTEVFETFNDDGGVYHKDKKLKRKAHERVENRRKLYKFAESTPQKTCRYIHW